MRRRQDIDLLAWRMRVSAVAAGCEQSAPNVAWRWNTRYNRHRDEGSPWFRVSGDVVLAGHAASRAVA